MRKIVSFVIFSMLVCSLVFADVLDFGCGDYGLSFDDDKFEFTFYADSSKWPLVADRAMIGSSRLRGASRVRSQSLFTITAIAPETNRILTLNTDVADSTSYELIDNGVCVTYYFDDGIGFSASIFLSDDGLNVSVDTSSFKESEELFISSIQFLPFFSASSLNDNGYFIIPDGSGAVVEFNNGKRGTYNEPVYGDDMVDTKNVEVTSSLPISLPLIGINKDNLGSMIAVASSSAAMANVVCSTSNENNPYNIAFFVFNLRTSIEERIASDAAQIVYESPRIFNGVLSVTYTLCPEPGYVAMADTFKSLYLDENEEAVDCPVVLTVKGARNEEVEVLGIPTPFSQNHRVIGFEDVLDILSSIPDSDFLIEFEDWNNRVLKGKNQEDFKFSRALGSGKDRAEFIEYAEKKGIVLSASVSSVESVFRRGDVIRDLSGKPSRLYEYDPASSSTKKETGRYLLNVSDVDFVSDESGSFYPSYLNVGTMVYSDYSTGKAMDRCSYTTMVEEYLNEIGNYMVYGGNYYTLDGALHVFDAPYLSSRAAIFDYEIPFYEIVLSGRISYSFDAVNRSGNPLVIVLKTLETGAALDYEISDVSDSDYINDSLSEYLSDVSLISSSEIVEHERVDGHVVRTLFDNGYEVLVDYESLTYKIEEKK